MSKIVYFNIPSTGHVNPSLSVIKELVERGEDVVYVNSEKLRSKIESTGARFVPYPDITEIMERVDSNIHNFPRAGLMLLQLSDRLMPSVTAIVEQEKPDFIMYDTFAIWGRMTSQKMSLPSICFSTTFAFRPNFMNTFTARTIALTSLQFLNILPRYIVSVLSIRQRHGMFPPALSNILCCKGDMNLVFTSRKFQPAGDSYDDTFHFVGPALRLRPFDGDFPFDNIRQDVPLVYISLGTIAKNMEFFKTCFRAFSVYPAQFILSVGLQTDFGAFPPIPDNFIVRNFVPQLEILKRMDAVITHGGLNTTHESLYFGVPMVIIPQQIEQTVVALQLQNFKAGIALRLSPPFNKINPLRLKRALGRVLGESTFKENAKMLGDSLRSAGGEKYAADMVQEFANKMQNGVSIKCETNGSLLES